MGFVRAALSNTTFLCGAIVVTAAVAMLSDLSEVASGRFILHPLDISDLLLLLFITRYLQCTEADYPARGLVKGMLFILEMMLSITYAFL